MIQNVESRIGRLMALIILATAGCLHAQSRQPPVPKSSQQIALWVVEAVWNNGDFRLVNQMFLPDALFHYRGKDYPLTPEFGIETVRSWRNAFPDFHFKIEDTIVQANKIALRIPFTGTHQGKFWGLEPTGRQISVTETLILRIRSGKIAEMWEDYDEYGMRMQLGLAASN